jgi:hypothetical protein
MKTFIVIVTAVLLVVSARAETPAPPAGAPSPAPAKTAKAGEPGGTPRRLAYVRPKTGATGTRVDGDGGSRGGGVKMPSLYVLAPNHTGLTARAQPSLFWYQSGPASTRFELTIIEPKKPKPVLQVGAEAADQPGIHRLPLGKYNVTLTPGILYKWTIALVPDPANRSQDIIASGTIQRTEPDAQFTSALADAQGLDKAVICAGQGYWYDALEAVTKEIDAAPKDKALRLQRAILLDQAGLKDAAASERK